MARRMEERAVYEKPFVVAGCMAAAQRDRVQSIVPRAKVSPPRKWPQIVELLGAGTACGDRAAEIESTSFGWRDAIVPIAQGCAGSCTYCITRVAFFFSSRRRHTRLQGDWSSDVCSSD